MRKSRSTGRRKARKQYYTTTRYPQRIKDEQELGILIEDSGLWLSDMKKYDLKGIDDPLPKGINTFVKVKEIRYLGGGEGLMLFQMTDTKGQLLPISELYEKLRQHEIDEIDEDFVNMVIGQELDWEEDNTTWRMYNKYIANGGDEDNFWNDPIYDELMNLRTTELLEDRRTMSDKRLEQIYNGYEIFYDLQLMDGDKQIGVLPFHDRAGIIGIGSAKVEVEYQSLGLYNYLRRELVNIADQKQAFIKTGASGFDSDERLKERGITQDERDRQLYEYYASWGDVSGEFGETLIRPPHK